MRYLRLILLPLLVAAATADAQDREPVVMRAMRDELARNMKELKWDNYAPPFFISYSLQDRTEVNIRASLGAVMNASKSFAREPLSLRIMVGNYEFNDESLDVTIPPTSPSGLVAQFPINDDYEGIRRALWIWTDQVYKSAAQKFARAQEMVKERDKPLDQLPHRWFAKTKPAQVNVDQVPASFNQQEMETLMRKLSSTFRQFSQVEQSEVGYSLSEGYRYLVNSEGSSCRIPFRNEKVIVTYSLKSESESRNGERHVLLFTSKDLADANGIEAKIKEGIEVSLKALGAAQEQEEYAGPVMLEGDMSPFLFIMQMMTSETSMRASDEVPDLKGTSTNRTTPDTKIGKQVYPSGMNVVAMPLTKSFEGIPLVGSYLVDSEGTAPEGETVIVENGVLKNLLNNRTLTSPTQVANGHADGPGVLKIGFNATVPYAQMKAQLIDRAKKEGLEFGFIVRGRGFDLGSYQYVKVFVADGHEEFVSGLRLDNITPREFKRLETVAKEFTVFQVDVGEPLSIICPKAVLLDDVLLKPHQRETFTKEKYVPSPFD